MKTLTTKHETHLERIALFVESRHVGDIDLDTKTLWLSRPERPEAEEIAILTYSDGLSIAAGRFDAIPDWNAACLCAELDQDLAAYSR